MAGTETKPPLHPEKEWFDSLPRLKVGDLELLEEKNGLIEGGQICNLNGRDVPYQIWNDPQYGIRLRKLSPDAPDLKLVAVNGTIHEIKADKGFVIVNTLCFIIDGKFYKLDGNNFIPLTEDEEKQAKEKITNAPK
ncbi:MAG: hypothetical protein QHH09_02615 [Microgenomates group bacterium]|nr:hypothetical protein [Microgenomates group bacterium]